ncbi:TIGR04282 family arsenosugar biosynthesis glycosyltransferase [Synechocystis sp. PCC 7509]|uniref:TIGR04282 family arsenosugar biosynthesis glycosyltransferase n=1 Tax=Synechocystis sp. PCC 7509 TaxID=927677 RepID=UPI0002AC0399|nr:TIGR04282 family arsenosugar biosynthesis glycosyltransferase [Synechocystis sp. PCC 7509]
MQLSKIIKKRLIIFTRYPEPGKTKTRMIGALGEIGAANLQRQMTEHTLAQAQLLQEFCPVSIEVRFASGDKQLMQQWLGDDIDCLAQGEGDLGQKMAYSLLSAFQNQIESVVIIGSDCPGLTPQLIAQAFQQLDLGSDLVLGSAIDGGYYLIALSKFIPELFTGISWGSDRVLAQTVAIAHKLNLIISYLPPLADVDRPEDLPIWEQTQKEC